MRKLGSALLVCPRVNDMTTPKVASRTSSCERCGEFVWRALDGPEQVTGICIQCSLVHGETHSRVLEEH